MQTLPNEETVLSGLPSPIATYFAAGKAQNTALLDQCFTPDARVHDENQKYHGLPAIKAWQQETQDKYQFTALPLESSVWENTITIRARVTGSFPGSPIELDYTFTLVNDWIGALEIH